MPSGVAVGAWGPADENQLTGDQPSGLLSGRISAPLVQEASWRGPRLYFRGHVIATIVQDVRYPDMWRVRLPDGTISDMVNLTRAKDAAMWLTGAQIANQNPT